MFVIIFRFEVIVLILPRLINFIGWGFRCFRHIVIILTYNSSQSLRRFYIPDFLSTFRRLGNVLHFTTIVVTISGHIIEVFIRWDFRLILLVFIGEIKFHKKLSLLFSFSDVEFGLLFVSQYIPSFWKLLYLFEIFITSQIPVNIFNIVQIVKRDI